MKYVAPVAYLFLLVFLTIYYYQIHSNPNQSLKTRLPTPTSQKLTQKVERTPTDQHTLTLDQIFGEKPHWIIDLDESNSLKLIATGDVMLGRSVNMKTTQDNNFPWPFEKTAHYLQEADLTLVNLEGPFIENCPITNENTRFCSDPRNIEGLLLAGIDIVTLANNHSGDYGKIGIEQTKILLEEKLISTVGLNNIEYIHKKGKKIAVMGYNQIIPRRSDVSWLDENKTLVDVRVAKKNADIVIVSFHWGSEYTEKPSKEQIDLAHKIIDSGADLIIGHHPHWIQPIEIYNDKLIVYSLGNFIFDQMWSQKTREGLVGAFMFYEGKLVDATFEPVLIEDFGQPRVVTGDRRQLILRNLEKISEELLVISS